MLGHPIIRRIRLVEVDAVTKPRNDLSGPLLVPLQAGEILIPAHVLRDRKLGKLHLQANVLHIVRKRRTQQTAHIFENERTWLNLGNRPDRLRKHIPRIVHARRFTTHGERLTWWAARDKIDTAILPEIDIPHVGPRDIAACERFMTHFLIVTKRLNRGSVPFIKGAMLETRRVKPKRQSSRA